MSSLWNGKPRQPWQIPKQGVWSKLGKAVRTKLAELPQVVKLASALTLCVLAGLLSGCAVTSTPSSEPARNPSPPPTTLSASPPDYLSDALNFISESRKTLQGLLPK
jgi:hypothetical protein